MPRPDFITQEDLTRWSENISSDTNTFYYVKIMPSLLEVLFAGLWLAENLQQLKCNPLLISRIQYTAGQLAFGKDPWEVHQEMLRAYQNNELEFEIDYDDED
jgi:hypothetical protein